MPALIDTLADACKYLRHPPRRIRLMQSQARAAPTVIRQGRRKVHCLLHFESKQRRGLGHKFVGGVFGIGGEDGGFHILGGDGLGGIE